ncbi:MAG: ubiquinone biosynthesis protein [Candidatus Azotimanducaceae bacterium]|jgi:ubiquinone biosynthesis protein
MRIFRILKILRVVFGHRLDRLITNTERMPFIVRALLLLLKIFPEPNDSPASSLRRSLEQLGPIFVKFGQILSTRKDLFDPETSAELEKLQDSVPPFDSLQAANIIEQSLEDTIDNLFASFDTDPLASASVAQVHAAVLHSGESVVVKVIRPGIDSVIKEDIRVMHLIAHWLEKLSDDGKRLHPVQVVRDYERTILDELNLHLEGANGVRLKNNWDNSGKLYVPKVYWDYTRTNILVLERIYGIGAADVQALKDQNVDMKKLAHLGVEIFFTQVFEQNFFHADMHPGNVFIDATDPANPSYIALDCAIMGSLTEEDKNYLARNLLAFFQQDYLESARLHVESGWVPPDTDIKEFEAVIRSVCEPIFQKPISEISFGRVLMSLFQTARRFNMEVQPQLVLLQKTLLNIEGMGRQIYPDLDLWETAAPFMERWMKDRLGIKGLLNRFGKAAPKLFEQLPELPQFALDTMSELKQLGRNNRTQALLLRDLKTTIEHGQNERRQMRLGGLAITAAFIAIVMTLSTGTAFAASSDLIIGSSIVGSLGVYWMFAKA